MAHYAVVKSISHHKDMKIPACKRSSKSRAANFFISEALFENRRMTPQPNVGICRKLIDISFDGDGMATVDDIASPFIQLGDQLSRRGNSIQDTYQVSE